MDTYQYLKDICNLKMISSQGSVTEDLLRYYNYSNLNLSLVLDTFNTIYREFWSRVQYRKNQEEDPITKIKLIRPIDGKYTRIIKVDFKRAFTNYSVKYLSTEELKLYNYFCNKISRAYLLQESKKFLYNYVLTNIITNISGKEKLNQLRYNVYEDVLYLASRYGEIIKSEVDGCYVMTNETNYNYLEVLGEYSILKFDCIYFLDKGLQISKLNKDKVEVKGINKNEPNIYTIVLREFVKNFKDSLLDKFFFNNKVNYISDWIKKSKDGLTGTLCLKNTIINVDTSTSDKISYLDKYNTYLSKNAYFSKVSKYLEQIMLYK